MKKILFYLLICCFALVSVFLLGKNPVPLLKGSASAMRLNASALSVITDRLTLVDLTRNTEPLGDGTVIEGRTLELKVWKPRRSNSDQSIDHPMPLVIYSHGFMSNASGGEYLGEHLASLGYIVVAPTFPLTNYSAPGGAKPEDVVSQPGDVSFIIDHFLTQNSKLESNYYSLIDESKIAAVGMSLGGLTTALAAYHPEMGDDRIVAAVSIAGPTYMFARQFFVGHELPFLMVASPQDALINYQQNAADILDRVNNACLVSIDSASHIGFSGGGKWLRWFDNPDSLGCSTLQSEDAAEAEYDWYHKIGSAKIGVLPAVKPIMCEQEPLPSAMNPIRQLEFTTLAVSAFLECKLGADQTTKTAACAFIGEQFASEFEQVSVQCN